MYFNFEDYRPDTPTLPRSLTRLEVVLLTIVFYLCIVIVILVTPKLPWVKAWEAERQQALQEQTEAQRQRESARFVFVAPKMDIQAMKPPPRHELSDIDRKARTVERAPKPTNTMPFSRGNTTERMDGGPDQRAAATEERPNPTPPQGLTLPDSPSATESRPADSAQASPRGPAVGVLADAIRNAQRYASKDSFVNLQGGADQDFAPAIQFDTKGVEFGPWLRRFIAQIRRNWFIPMAAMSLKGHVSITFYVGKDGRITELRVLRPAGVDAFNNSAYNALAASNPTQPLPPEYPDDRAFFTITFYFNETPPS
ncbi:MAG: TonB family protein [Acidobacteriota bacterium]